MPVPVSVENFVRAETDRMFSVLQAQAGGVNRMKHNRAPTPIDDQPGDPDEPRHALQRAIVDISEGATVTIPDGGERYVSVMVVNQDHYINRILHDAGQYTLTVDEFDTPWVTVGARVLVDPADSDDLAVVNALQDQLTVEANSARPFEMPGYEKDSFDATRNAALELGKHQRIRLCVRGQGGGRPGAASDRDRCRVGRSARSRSPVHQRRSSAACRRVPARCSGRASDGFWSISLYNVDGYFEVTSQAPTASTTSLQPGTTTAPSLSTSAGPTTIGRIACRSWTAGTTPSGFTDHDLKCSMAPGHSPRSRPHEALVTPSIFRL